MRNSLRLRKRLLEEYKRFLQDTGDEVAAAILAKALVELDERDGGSSSLGVRGGGVR